MPTIGASPSVIPLRPLGPEPFDQRDHQRVHHPVRRIRVATHQVEVAVGRGVGVEHVDEGDDPSGVAVADGEDRRVAEPGVVELAHGERPLAVPGGQPALGDVAQLGNGVVVDRGRQFDHVEPGALHPAQRGPQGLVRRDLEPPVAYVDHRLLADLHRLQSGLSGLRSTCLGELVERRSPTVQLTPASVLGDGRSALVGRSDRVAECDRHAAHDHVGDERRPVGGEEERLVVADLERGEGRVAPQLRELVDGTLLGERHGPHVGEQQAGGSGERDHQGGDPRRLEQPAPVHRGDVGDARAEQEHRAQGVVDGDGEADVVVELRAEQDQAEDAVGQHDQASDDQDAQRVARSRRVVAGVERIPAGEQGDQQGRGGQHADQVLVVGVSGNDRDRRGDDADEPGVVLGAVEAAADPDEGDAGGPGARTGRRARRGRSAR